MLEVIVFAGVAAFFFLVHDLAEHWRGRRSLIFRSDPAELTKIAAEVEVRPKGRVNPIRIRCVRVPKGHTIPGREFIRHHLAGVKSGERVA